MIKRKEITEDTLEQALRKILDNYDFYRENLKKGQKAFEEA
jgi:hypothetical protein